MNISPSIPLVLGIIAGSLFVLTFVVALILTIRNRRKLREGAENSRV